jgi:hypothetical protein
MSKMKAIILALSSYYHLKNNNDKKILTFDTSYNSYIYDQVPMPVPDMMMYLRLSTGL